MSDSTAGMGARLIVVEGRAGRSEAESRKRGDGLLGATGSDGAEGACADGIFDTGPVASAMRHGFAGLRLR